MAPGPNRVESDELTYGLHILIRTDLEIALLEEGLAVKDLPGEWNRRYRELLGVTHSMCKNFGEFWPTGTRDMWVEHRDYRVGHRDFRVGHRDLL